MKKLPLLIVLAFTLTTQAKVPPHSRMLVGPPKPVLVDKLITCDVEIIVPGLVCPSCAIGIKKNLAKLFSLSVKDITFDVKNQSVCLKLSSFFQDNRKDFLKKYEAKIKKSVKDAGYEVKTIKVKLEALV